MKEDAVVSKEYDKTDTVKLHLQFYKSKLHCACLPTLSNGNLSLTCPLSLSLPEGGLKTPDI